MLVCYNTGEPRKSKMDLGIYQRAYDTFKVVLLHVHFIQQLASMIVYC